MTEVITETDNPRLPDWQFTIGLWASQTFGPTPLAVHANRMMAEMVDVLDCAATGDEARLPRSVAGVVVVALAIAEAQGFDLEQALFAEHTENDASEWRETPWGHWRRVGDGQVIDDDVTAEIVTSMRHGALSPQSAGRLLQARGAGLFPAIDFLVAAGADRDAFQNPAPSSAAKPSNGETVND